MTAGHGGARPGAGRKPGKSGDAKATRYDDALAYLAAVVRGDEPPNGLRIAAAKSVLPYQAPKARAPVQSPPPAKLRSTVERSADRAEADDYQRRAAAVRLAFSKGKKA